MSIPSPHTKHDSGFALDHPLLRVGTATSDWQINPRESDSDWGEELRKKLNGECSGIVGAVDPQLLPEFDALYSSLLQKAASLKGNAFRLSFDFARLCPGPGVFRTEVMEQYLRVLARCHAQGLQPMVTLYHWPLPKSFAVYDDRGRIQRGALEHPGIVDHFAFYVRNVANALQNPDMIRCALTHETYEPTFIEKLCSERSLVKQFVSINEPLTILWMAYGMGTAPPHQHWRLPTMCTLARTLKEMHRHAHAVLHKGMPEVEVGIAHSVFHSHLPVIDGLMNWGIVQYLERGLQTDFLGIQYYNSLTLRSLLGLPSPLRWKSDFPQMGPVSPWGMYHVLKKAAAHFPHKKILVTEFGFADRSDRKRPAWMLQTVRQVIRALREGVPVEGLYCWSLINNLEWHLGTEIDFGLLDHQGKDLHPGTHLLTSAEAWSAVSRHLLHPTQASAELLAALEQRANAQLEAMISTPAAHDEMPGTLRPGLQF